MNTQIMEAAGFHKELALISEGLCPTCAKPVGKFRDQLSKKEFAISGMCQACQDSVFNPNCESEDSYENTQKEAFEEASSKGLLILTHCWPVTDKLVISVDIDSYSWEGLLPSELVSRTVVTVSAGGNRHLYAELTQAATKKYSDKLPYPSVQALLACHFGGDPLREALSLQRFQVGEKYSHNMFEKPEEADHVLKAFPGHFGVITAKDLED